MPLNPTRLRSMVAGWLNDTCTIRSPGRPEYDADLGYDVTTTGDTVYSGPCRLRPTGGDRIVIAGEAPITLRMYDLTLPWDATGLKVDQVVTLDESNDPHSDGRTFTVTDIQGGTDTAYRRLIVEEVVDIDEGEAA